jgi:cystathionine beta-lyase
MKYDFEKQTNRYGTASVKWDLAETIFKQEQVLPMWVADMDFEIPKPVIDALVKRAEHGIFGYTACMEPYYEATINWIRKQHDWTVEKEWVVFSPGVIPALNMLVQALTLPGEKVIVQKPVYYPFMQAIENNKRTVINNPLKFINRRYEMNFCDLEEKALDPLAKLLILCSPHNPVGRVWTRDELSRLGRICTQNNIIIIADEIHSDLVLKGSCHTPFASMSEDFLTRSVTCTAPSKTFNLAGLHVSNIIIPDPKIREKFTFSLKCNGIMGPSVFGATALVAAYSHGKEWLQQVLEYIQDNLEFLKSFIKQHLPLVEVIEPEATYLVWLDFRGLALKQDEIKRIILNEAKVALDPGHIFGREGRGFQRINIACPRSVLEQGLLRIEKALKKNQELCYS